MAGFGAAGSILAGCAVLFVVVSAVVAFRGWPKIVTQGTPVALRLRVLGRYAVALQLRYGDDSNTRGP